MTCVRDKSGAQTYTISDNSGGSRAAAGFMQCECEGIRGSVMGPRPVLYSRAVRGRRKHRGGGD